MACSIGAASLSAVSAVRQSFLPSPSKLSFHPMKLIRTQKLPKIFALTSNDIKVV
uniref:Uncharacterized protein n=1 Tax=Kalanchoe fedtschenkoi TaxID=63787 RepID=A0A7N0V9B5_KALFE